MNEEQYAKVKGAALLFRAMGGTLKTNVWGFTLASEKLYGRPRICAKPKEFPYFDPPCLCPMAALLLCEQPDPRFKQAVTMCAEVLRTRLSLVESFISGWDGSAPYKGHEQAPGELRAWYMAGRRMHHELMKSA